MRNYFLRLGFEIKMNYFLCIFFKYILKKAKACSNLKM